MKILISGASGFLGTAVCAALEQQGHQLSYLVRRTAANAQEIQWDATRGTIDNSRLPGHEAVVHLAGENIAAKRWNRKQRQRIQQSRVRGTQVLCQALGNLPEPPTCLISASAVGYYGNRGVSELTEDSPAGRGFLAETGVAWEAAAAPARDAGIRVVYPRFGMVVASHGGALAKMLPIFRLGLGGKIGSGQQYLSWISLRDAVAVILWALQNDVSGHLNAVSPHPVTNLEFTKALGGALHRPTICGVPALAIRLLLGGMADGLLLSSARVLPEKLQKLGFQFQDPELLPLLQENCEG